MSLKEALLDLLFPPRCPICGRSSDGEKDAHVPRAARLISGSAAPRPWCRAAPLSGASAPGGIAGR